MALCGRAGFAQRIVQRSHSTRRRELEAGAWRKCRANERGEPENDPRVVTRSRRRAYQRRLCSRSQSGFGSESGIRHARIPARTARPTRTDTVPTMVAKRPTKPSSAGPSFMLGGGSTRISFAVSSANRPNITVNPPKTSARRQRILKSVRTARTTGHARSPLQALPNSVLLDQSDLGPERYCCCAR